MKYRFTVVLLFLISSLGYAQPSQTVVSIEDEKFYINGKPTYEGRTWQGHTVEGLLFNSRMVQGIFDDLNPDSRSQWKYPDTNKWSAERNTDEFVAAMDEWYSYGLLAFSLNLQGGSPVGYGNNDWINSAFDQEGNMRPAYFQRLDKILKKADDLGMVVILGLFYFGQDQHLKDEKAILNAVDQTMKWLFEKEYRNILIEACNETDVKKYDHAILKTERIHEIIQRVKDKEQKGYRYLATTSYGGGSIPTPNVIKVSDYILIHGNGVGDPDRIAEMVKETREVEGYTSMPIVFNEDDHYDFSASNNNMVAAIKQYASWGYFDFRRDGEPFEEGYQSVPVDWSVNSSRKKAFFEKVKEISGGNSSN